ncbi:unnamed protein product [Ectocarpus sp. 8 AP-2014]|uniref:Uncharacterized protein n=1 Tax=Ectocarpus siliculosus TaxID=2880 RepID=D8LQA8_ECTSI|nr:expressed unknown protein [Ectocarpus siliculosus]|eukprot:CBN77488.1 expressed unknown protein [Ectocarpus siliculosus]
MPHTAGQGLARHRLPGDTRGGEEEEEAGSDHDARESSERYFSARWMLERERAREESDDCSQAFAIIPVVGVCLMVLYVVWLDQASQGLLVWLAGGSPLAELVPFKMLGEMVGGGDEMAIPGAYA